MKKILTGAALLCLMFTVSTPVLAADVCEVVVCMYGKVTGGDGGKDCTAAERDFFSINAFKKKGRFDPTKTADMRKALLNGCSGADPVEISKIIAKFGTIRG
ncbi:TPA: conjugal transfer protein [Yersinia enterocolitica]|nr:conjugal transfer protein [Yersinia enterocolitica]